MDKILEIVYNFSINNKVIDLNSIEKIIELASNDKKINNYISNISFISNNNNNNILASYYSSLKKIVVNKKVIDKMISNIENNAIIKDSFQLNVYKNLSVLQVLFHEIEHVYQEKILYLENNLETFIIRLSYMIDESKCKELYEFCPYERLAEINSYEYVCSIVDLERNKLNETYDFLKTDKQCRLLMGYHYYEPEFIKYPLNEFFEGCNRKELLNSFDWYNDDNTICLNNSLEIYNLYDRYKYGFPVSSGEYAENMMETISFYNKNFKNKVLIK